MTCGSNLACCTDSNDSSRRLNSIHSTASWSFKGCLHRLYSWDYWDGFRWKDVDAVGIESCCSRRNNMRNSMCVPFWLARIVYQFRRIQDCFDYDDLPIRLSSLADLSYSCWVHATWKMIIVYNSKSSHLMPSYSGTHGHAQNMHKWSCCSQCSKSITAMFWH